MIATGGKTCYTVRMANTNRGREVFEVANTSKYFIVEASALPEIFLKVAEAKQMLSAGQCQTVGEAAKRTGISRSAFYKYKDAIAPMQNLMAGRILTFQMMLRDEAGVLSCILSIFAVCGANILTINQSIPQNGCAMLTISAQTAQLQCSVEHLLHEIGHTKGVVRAEIIAG